MPTSAIMKHTAITAQRTVLIALIGAAVMVTVVIIERTSFERAQRDAMLELLGANQTAAQILLADERLTMAANLAATTGERRWLKRYEANLSLIKGAIHAASTVSDSPSARGFMRKAETANERLLSLEDAAFKSLEDGDRKAARRVLDSGLYRHYKQVLADSTAGFFDSALTGIRSKLLMLQDRTEIALPLILVLCGLGAYALWYRLNVSLARSQSAFVRAEGTIRSLAMNDALTGLANRRALFSEFREALATAKRDHGKLAVLMIDLDRFKPINDQHGHLVGDLVLKQVAYRLATALPDARVQGRYGGDEFVAVLPFEGDDKTVQRMGRRVVESLLQPMSLAGLWLQIGASVGSAIYPSDATTDEELIRKADLALRHAKKYAPGATVAYDTSLDAETDERAELETDLRTAIATETLVPYYQPVIDLRSGKTRSFEILCRWPHPTRGLLQPNAFIPLAEATGLIHKLTLSLLRAACVEARALPEHITLALNIAPQQIQDASLAHKILAVLSETDFPPSRLEVELTETALVTDLPAAKHVISSLKALGIRVALDDFGTGYSSLYYLSELPIDMIKIDGSFIRSMQEREESGKIVTAILGLGKSLNLAAVAECVETEGHANFLKAKGCPLAQGNFFGKPMPIDEAVAFLARREPATKGQMVA
jgi:diguanylate cyclase (GGDEF)-like protein